MNMIIIKVSDIMNNKNYISFAVLLLLCVLFTFSGCTKNVAPAATLATSDEASAAVSSETVSAQETGTQSTSSEATETNPEGSVYIPQNPDTNSGNTHNSNSSGNHKPNTNISGGSVADAGPSDSAKRCTITVGNKGYVTDVGDTVTYTFYLTTPKKVEDVQAALTYDSRMLKLKTTDAENLFPVMGSGVIHNTNIKDTIKFNAVNISGFDFTKRGSLITAEFEVLKNGGTNISTAIEIMTEKGGEVSYFDGFIMTKAVTCEEILTQ